MTKLVRNLVPAVVEAKGETEPFRLVVDDAEHDALLRKKVDEEITEWDESEDPMELADVLAVVRDIAARKGTSWQRLLQMEERKREQLGGFSDGVVWLGEPLRYVRGRT